MAIRWKKGGRRDLRVILATLLNSDRDIAVLLARWDAEGSLAAYGTGHISRKQYDAILAEARQLASTYAKQEGR